jgi:hypothetical protein
MLSAIMGCGSGTPRTAALGRHICSTLSCETEQSSLPASRRHHPWVRAQCGRAGAARSRTTARPATSPPRTRQRCGRLLATHALRGAACCWRRSGRTVDEDELGRSLHGVGGRLHRRGRGAVGVGPGARAHRANQREIPQQNALVQRACGCAFTTQSARVPKRPRDCAPPDAPSTPADSLPSSNGAQVTRCTLCKCPTSCAPRVSRAVPVRERRACASRASWTGACSSLRTSHTPTAGRALVRARAWRRAYERTGRRSIYRGRRVRR